MTKFESTRKGGRDLVRYRHSDKGDDPEGVVITMAIITVVKNV